MKTIMMATVVTALLLCTSLGATVTVQEHPIAKVITMLEDLATKAEAEGKEEAVSFSKYQYWCKNSAKELSKAIAEEKETIDSLANKIDAKTKEAATLEEEIAALDDQLAKMEAAGKKADEQRKAAKKLYEKNKKDLKDGIKAVEKCEDEIEHAGETAEASLVQKRV